MAQERERGWLTLKRAVPAPAAALLVAKTTATVLIASVSLGAIYAVAAFAAGVELSSLVWLGLLLVHVLSAIPFVLLGLALGFVFGANAAVAVANIAYLGMAVLGGLWMPISVFPKIMGQIAQVLPSYHLAEIALGVSGAGGETALPGHILAALAITPSPPGWRCWPGRANARVWFWKAEQGRVSARAPPATLRKPLSHGVRPSLQTRQRLGARRTGKRSAHTGEPPARPVRDACLLSDLSRFYFTPWFFQLPGLRDALIGFAAVGSFIPVYLYANAGDPYRNGVKPVRTLMAAGYASALSLALIPVVGMSGNFHIYAVTLLAGLRPQRVALLAMAGLSAFYLCASWLLGVTIFEMVLSQFIAVMAGMATLAGFESAQRVSVRERNLRMEPSSPPCANANASPRICMTFWATP